VEAPRASQIAIPITAATPLDYLKERPRGEGE